MRISIALFILVAVLTSLTGVARADDWTAVRLRGQVQQFVGEQWQPLRRGDVVPDSRLVRTAANGHVTFQRGNETVAMADNTQIRIFDRPGSKTGRPFTTVEQDFGTVAVEADVRQVQHFAVETPYVAAVVKGTKFTVVQGKDSASVSVQRGHVFVEDRASKDQVTIGVGQSATIAPKTAMVVAGRGRLPAVTDQHGKAVAAETSKAANASKGKSSGSASAAENKGNNGQRGRDSFTSERNDYGRGNRDHGGYDRGNNGRGDGDGRGGGGGGGGRGRGHR
jgi:hypothetical protein